MSLDTKSLKELCGKHSVAGDTMAVIAYLKDRLAGMGIGSKTNGYGVLVFGNTKNPKVMISAHVDEVGFQVSRKNEDGSFGVIRSGLIDPVMLNNSQVYVSTDKGEVEGVFYPRKTLGDNKPENFGEIFLDTVDNGSVVVGDYGSYRRMFAENGDKVIAAGLDNKIGVQMIFDLIAANPKMLSESMFAFATEEELSYVCTFGLGHQYAPEYALVLDMFPTHQLPHGTSEANPVVGEGPAVLVGLNSYHLHESVRRMLPELRTKHQRVFADIAFAPEVEPLQKNGTTKGVNIFVPMLGWHNSAYSMSKKDYAGALQLTDEIYQKLMAK